MLGLHRIILRTLRTKRTNPIEAKSQKSLESVAFIIVYGA